MFKVKNNIAPEITKEPFAPKMSPDGICNNRRRVNKRREEIREEE